MGDEIEVELIHAIAVGSGGALECDMRFRGCNLGVDQLEPPTNTEHMRVYGHRRPAQTEKQNAGCCFGTYARKRRKPVARLVRGALSQPIERKNPGLGLDDAKDCLNARRLDFSKTAAANRVGH